MESILKDSDIILVMDQIGAEKSKKQLVLLSLSESIWMKFKLSSYSREQPTLASGSSIFQLLVACANIFLHMINRNMQD